MSVTLDRSARLGASLLLMCFVVRTLAHGQPQAPPSM